MSTPSILNLFNIAGRRNFNKKIIITEKTLNERKIYGKFKKENLSEILQAISIALDIQYEITEKEIRLKVEKEFLKEEVMRLLEKNED